MQHRTNTSWQTRGIKVSCRNKRKMYHQTKGSSSQDQKIKYARCCKILKRVIKQSRRITNANFISSSTNKTKATWALIKRHTQSANILQPTIECIVQNNNVLKTPLKLASTFNHFFINQNCNVSTTSSHRLQTTLNSNSIFLSPVDRFEVINIVKNLKNKSSYGHNNIPIKVIKESIPFIADPLR